MGFNELFVDFVDFGKLFLGLKVDLVFGRHHEFVGQDTEFAVVYTDVLV